MRILVAEGDPKLSQPLSEALEEAAWAVDVVETAQEAREVLYDVFYDLVLVGRALPDDDGLELVVSVPERTGLVVIGWDGGTAERGAVLAEGPDDCVDPDTCIEELVVRVAKVLERRTSATLGPVRLGRAVVDRIRRVATVDGEVVPLSSTQFCLLDHIVAYRHRLVTISELLDQCWNAERDLFSDPLPSQIHRLRLAFRGVLEFTRADREGYVLEVSDDDRSSPE